LIFEFGDWGYAGVNQNTLLKIPFLKGSDVRYQVGIYAYQQTMRGMVIFSTIDLLFQKKSAENLLVVTF
jgi:hypothetical protein